MRHEEYMKRRIREEEEATIRSLASSDTPSAIPEVNDIRQMLERIEKKIDKLIEKRG
jgi:ubiquinone biosynthesis protein UbiJ